MKRFLLVVLVASSLAACKKNGVTPSVNIVGKWELHERKGGNILPQDTTYQAGNGNIYQFNSDSSYKQFTNGALTASGTFQLYGNQLYFNNGAYIDQAFYYTASVSGNILTIRPWIADIATTMYDKIQN
jgi:hypothetical protein